MAPDSMLLAVRAAAVRARLLVLVLAGACLACSAIDDAPVRDGALRAWYLPLSLLLVALRAGARRETRRALSLALVILGVGALAARAVDAHSESSEAAASSALLKRGSALAEGVLQRRSRWRDREARLNARCSARGRGRWAPACRSDVL